MVAEQHERCETSWLGACIGSQDVEERNLHRRKAPQLLSLPLAKRVRYPCLIGALSCSVGENEDVCRDTCREAHLHASVVCIRACDIRSTLPMPGSFFRDSRTVCKQPISDPIVCDVKVCKYREHYYIGQRPHQARLDKVALYGN